MPAAVLAHVDARLVEGALLAEGGLEGTRSLAASSPADSTYAVTLKGSRFHASLLGRVVGKELGWGVWAKALRAMNKSRRVACASIAVAGGELRVWVGDSLKCGIPKCLDQSMRDFGCAPDCLVASHGEEREPIAENVPISHLCLITIVRSFVRVDFNKPNAQPSRTDHSA